MLFEVGFRCRDLIRYHHDLILTARVRATGEPAGAEGVEPMHKFPSIHARKIGGALKKHIQAKPKWVSALTAKLATPEAAVSGLSAT